jgi:hypothetical protein
MTVDPKETNHGTDSIFYSLSPEMREAILTEIDDCESVEHLYRQMEQREWEQKMRSTAPQSAAAVHAAPADPRGRGIHLVPIRPRVPWPSPELRARGSGFCSGQWL